MDYASENSDELEDICRVCRSEGASDNPLFYPCLCTGSIKYIHQECLVQWLNHSKKEYCELCKHPFAFQPIYSPDMPPRLPVRDIISGIASNMGTAVRYWLHYTLVTFAWLGVVPLSACRIYKSLFAGSVSSLLNLPFEIISTENIVSDVLQGCLIVACTLCAFISLVWLREQIIHGGGPEWLEQLHPHNAQAAPPPVAGGGVGVADQRNVRPVADPPPDPPPNPDIDPNPDLDPGADDPLVENEPEVIERGVNPPPQPPPVPNNRPPQDDINWNAIEWDRAAEELTWERMLGLDGSLVFLEHVFWVISLNTSFILLFAFCPYLCGHYIVTLLELDAPLKVTQFEGLIKSVVGYVSVALVLISGYMFMHVLQLQRFRRFFGLCYIVIKVSLLVLVEVGLFPLCCGWWIDICSLSLFDSSLTDRIAQFNDAPTTSMFIHWIVGMIFVFYFASFIMLLREILRPGVLWFLRNLNDPDFSPINEMIHLPIPRHIRRFLLSVVVFGTTIFLMIWMPVQTVKYLMPNFLPYNVNLTSDAPVSELSFELILLQVILPALLEQSQTQKWLKALIRLWIELVSSVLDLKSYLLGDEDNTDTDPVNIDPPNLDNINQEEFVEQADGNEEGNNGDDDMIVRPVEPQLAVANDNVVEPAPVQANPLADVLGGGLQAAHIALLQQVSRTGYQPFNKPTMFPLRLLLLIVLVSVTLYVLSTVGFILPASVGRYIISLWTGSVKIHEMYTLASGLYVCWAIGRIITGLTMWLPRGWNALSEKARECCILLINTLLAAVFLFIIIPYLLGLLFEIVVVVPIRVAIDQSPLFFPWQEWALGVLHAKIICAVTVIGPQWWLRRALERVYQDGIRNLNIHYTIRRLAVPVITALLLALTIPYLLSNGLIPLLGLGFETEVYVVRRIYPTLLFIILSSVFLLFQIKQFKRLYEHIKNDKYLIGRRLVNYERQHAGLDQQSPISPPGPVNHIL